MLKASTGVVLPPRPCGARSRRAARTRRSGNGGGNLDDEKGFPGAVGTGVAFFLLQSVRIPKSMTNYLVLWHRLGQPR